MRSSIQLKTRALMKLNLLLKRYTFNILVEDESDFETLR